ncbi:MAG: glycosyltransferase family 2 protein, partial [Pseudobutyrivibrio sp.]|nr:glycosyltransferase family 2 protein [Pseudobutyrivibrio sp.]
MNKKILSIVVPSYNEQEALPLFYNAIQQVKQQLNTVDVELWFIDDGSKDDTLHVIKRIAQADVSVHYVSFSRNFGKEAAIYVGLEHANGDYVVLMDADLQDPPALLPEMVAALDSGNYQCVATRRVDRKGEPPIRSFFARRFYKLINRWSDADIADGAR